MITADYVVVGTGLSGLSFADTIISQSDATVALIDYKSAPGGYWRTAHDYMRFDLPPSLGGMNGLALERRPTRGIDSNRNRPLNRQDMLAFFERLMSDRLLDSERVQYFSDCYHLGSGVVQAVGWNTRVHLKAKCKIVDATQCWHRPAISHNPCFQSATDVMIVVPRDLPSYWSIAPNMHEKYCVIGAGCTGLETVAHLLDLGVDADQICWVKPRDNWYWNSEKMAAHHWLDTLEIIAETDAFTRVEHALEQSGYLMRIDTGITPKKFHAAIKTPAQIARVQKIKHIVRKGHIHSVTSKGMLLDQGAEPMPKRTLYIDCTAGRAAARPQSPVFDQGMIKLQMLQMASAGFSAALIATIELMPVSEEEKAALCAPLSLPEYPSDIAILLKESLENQKRWLVQPAIRAWLAKNKIGMTGALLSALTETSKTRSELLATYNGYLPGALKALGAQIDRDALFDWSEINEPSRTHSPLAHGPE